MEFNNKQNLEELSTHYNPWVRRLVAMNSETSDALLEKLSNDTESLVRTGVALNTNTNAKILQKLAKDADSYVKAAVAENLNTDDQTLEELSYDEDNYVLAKVALHTRNLDTLKRLLQDARTDYLRINAVRNPIMPEEMLRELWKKTNPTLKYDNLRVEILKHPNCSIDILKWSIYNWTYKDEAIAVVKNPRMPYSLLKEIIDNEDIMQSIREEAKTNPNYSLAGELSELTSEIMV